MSRRRTLVTNFQAPATAGLSRAAQRLGVDLVVVDDLDRLGARGLRDVVGCLFFMYGYPEEAERQVNLARALRLPVALWQVDDPHYFLRPDLSAITRRIARKVDVYFSHTLELQAEYAALGVTVEYLPSGARELPGAEALVGPPPAEGEHELDYVFVATPSPSRLAAFERVQRSLPGLRGRFASGVSPLEALRLHRTSRVSLFVGAHTEAGGAPDSWGLSERSWDVPLVGGLLVQEDREHLREHFTPEVDAVTFRTLDECAAQVARLVAQPDVRREIARRAHEKVMAEHRLERRLERVLERLRAVDVAAARVPW